MGQRYRTREMLPLSRPISRDGNACLWSKLPIIEPSHDNGNCDGYLDYLVYVLLVTLLLLLLLKDKKNIGEVVYLLQGMFARMGLRRFLGNAPCP